MYPDVFQYSSIAILNPFIFWTAVQFEELIAWAHLADRYIRTLYNYISDFDLQMQFLKPRWEKDAATNEIRPNS